MSFGDELRRERELREISLREVSEATKINIRYLSALEKNDFDDLPGGVFNRGFVRAYAQYIGVDADGMVNAYLLEERSRAGDDSALAPNGAVMRGGAPETSEAPSAGGTTGPGRGVWIALAGLVILLAAVAAWWFWRPGGSTDGAAGGTDATAGTTVTPEPGPPADPSAAPSTSTGDDSTGDDTAGGDGEDPAPERREPRAATDTTTAARRDPADSPPAPVAAPATPDSNVTEAATPGSAVTGLRSTAQGAGAVVARIRVDAATSGRINCDNRQVEVLNGIPPGTRLEIACSRFLVLDVADGAAVRFALADEALQPAGPAGQPVRALRIDIADWLSRRGEEGP